MLSCESLGDECLLIIFFFLYLIFKFLRVHKAGAKQCFLIARYISVKIRARDLILFGFVRF